MIADELPCSDWVHDKYEDDREGRLVLCQHILLLYLTFCLARPSRGSRRGQRSGSGDGYGTRLKLRKVGNTDQCISGPALTKVRVDNLHYDITESDLEVCLSHSSLVTPNVV